MWLKLLDFCYLELYIGNVSGYSVSFQACFKKKTGQSRIIFLLPLNKTGILMEMKSMFYAPPSRS